MGGCLGSGPLPALGLDALRNSRTVAPHPWKRWVTLMAPGKSLGGGPARVGAAPPTRWAFEEGGASAVALPPPLPGSFPPSAESRFAPGNSKALGFSLRNLTKFAKR